MLMTFTCSNRSHSLLVDDDDASEFLLSTTKSVILKLLVLAKEIKSSLLNISFKSFVYSMSIGVDFLLAFKILLLIFRKY